MAENISSNVVQERANSKWGEWQAEGRRTNYHSDGEHFLSFAHARVAQSSKSGRRCGCIASVWSSRELLQTPLRFVIVRSIWRREFVCTYVTSYRRNHFSQLVQVRRKIAKGWDPLSFKTACIFISSQLRLRSLDMQWKLIYGVHLRCADQFSLHSGEERERWDAEKNSMFSSISLLQSEWIILDFCSGIKEFADQSTLTNYKLIEQLCEEHCVFHDRLEFWINTNCLRVGYLSDGCKLSQGIAGSFVLYCVVLTSSICSNVIIP